MDRLDALVAREKNGKTYWTKVGVAFASKNGGWKVHLDALPVGGELHLMPPREKRESQSERGEAFEGSAEEDKGWL